MLLIKLIFKTKAYLKSKVLNGKTIIFRGEKKEWLLVDFRVAWTAVFYSRVIPMTCLKTS